MRTSDFPIGTRIAAGFTFMVLLTVGLGLLALHQLSRVAATSELLATDKMPSIQLTGRLRDHLNDIRRYEARHLLSSERKEMRALEAKMADARKLLNGLDAEVASVFSSEAERQTIGRYLKFRQAWYDAGQKMAPASRAGKQDEATEIYNGESATAFDGTLAEVVHLSEHSAKEAEGAWNAAVQLHHRVRLGMILACILAAAIAAFIAIWLARSISRPINVAVEAAADIADGDMTMPLVAMGQDESARLLRALETMRGRLGEVVSTVRASSNLVVSTSADIAHGNHSLAEHTSSQAQAVRNTTASMSGLDAAVRSNASSAMQGNELARSASKVAERGRDAVGKVTEVMGEISGSSRRIADITSLIDGIAFQTNLLALNAAVEAARAGEHGRGFGVVAAEVRQLAGRCAVAANDIRSIVKLSVENVGAGAKLAKAAGATLQEVVDSVNSVSALMSTITEASQSQLADVAKVGLAVVDIDRATRQNAKLVGQLTQSADALEQQAADLVRTVAVFRLEGDELPAQHVDEAALEAMA